MAKEPPNTPVKGDRVQERGKPGREGLIVKWDPNGRWSTVEGDDGGGPRLCHRFGLERVAS